MRKEVTEGLGVIVTAVREAKGWEAVFIYRNAIVAEGER